MAEEWVNWSGSLRFAPGEIIAPGSEDELARVIEQAAGAGGAIRVAGAGHSSSPLVATDDTLISLRHLRDIEIHDAACGEATIGAGVTLHEAGKALLTHGLAFANLGDIDTQTAIGAFATGTHGTGTALANLSAYLVGGRMLTGAGEFVTFTAEEDPELTRAARVSLGVIGIMTAARVRLVPAFQLRKRAWCARVEDCLIHFDELAATLRNVDFYWYPRSDEVKIRTMDPVENPPAELPFARLQSEETGWSNAVIPNVRELRFEEMEYALPAEAGLVCFREVRQRVKERWRQLVGWRVLYRTVAGDDAYLSEAYDRPTVTISLHQNATLPYREYFEDIEPMFRAYGGRPHWGKKYTPRAGDQRPFYPEWDRFLEVRHSVDPEGLLLNAYLRDLLGTG